MLTANLDSLVRMATKELDRRLSITKDRETIASLTIDANPLDITDAAGNNIQDFRSILSLKYKGYPLIPTSFENVRGAPQQLGPYYYNSQNLIYFQLHEDALPLADQVTMQYRTKLPVFDDAADTSFLFDEYLDLLTYTTLKHAGAFVREDERIALWDAKSEALLQTVLDDQERNIEWGATPTEPRAKTWNP